MNNEQPAGTPSLQDTVIVSKKKRSFSTRQKLFGGIASFVAVAVVGFTGYSAFQGLTSDAAGEATLGRTNISIGNVSRYFRVTAYGQQDVKLAADGDAARLDGDQTTLLLNETWRIERTTNPNEASSWVVALDSRSTGYTGDNDDNQPLGLYDYASVVRDSADISCGYCVDDNAVNRAHDSASLQPNTTYYYRAAQFVEGQGWSPQEPVVHVRTLAYPTLTKATAVPGNSNQAKVGWTASNTSDEGLKGESYGEYQILNHATAGTQEVMKTFKAGDVIDPGSYASSTYWKNIIPATSYGADSQLLAGEVALAQPENTSYSYTLVRKIANRYLVLADSAIVTTAAQAVDELALVEYTGKNKSLTWSQNNLARTNVRITALVPEKVALTTVNINDARRNNYSCYSYSFSTPWTSADAFVIDMRCPTNNAAGSISPLVTVSGKTTSGQVISQTVTLPTLTINREANPISIKYEDTSINVNKKTKEATARLVLTSAKTPDNFCAGGKYQIKNLSNNKIIGQTGKQVVCSGSKTYIDIKKLKTGVLNLSVTYTDSNDQFKDKAFTLPKLTVN